MRGEVREGFLEEGLFLLKVKYLFTDVSVPFEVDEHPLWANQNRELGGAGEGYICPFPSSSLGSLQPGKGGAQT